MAPGQKTGRRDSLLLWLQRNCTVVSGTGLSLWHRRISPAAGRAGKGSLGSYADYPSEPNSAGNRCTLYPALLQGCDPAEAPPPCPEHSLILPAVIKKIAELKGIAHFLLSAGLSGRILQRLIGFSCRAVQRRWFSPSSADRVPSASIACFRSAGSWPTFPVADNAFPP